jgi:anti-anti-sigma factor
LPLLPPRTLLQVKNVEGSRMFRLVGEVDISSVEVLIGALETDIRSDGDLVLDLSGLAFMDLSGIHALEWAAGELGEPGRIILVSPGPGIRRLLQLVRLDTLPNVTITDAPAFGTPPALAPRPTSAPSKVAPAQFPLPAGRSDFAVGPVRCLESRR